MCSHSSQQWCMSGHDLIFQMSKDHDDGWPRKPGKPPQVRTGVQYVECNDHAEHLGEPKQEEYYQNEDQDKVGSWDISI